MANILLNYENFSVLGDGASLVATLYLPSVPVSASFVSAIDVSGGDPVDVSANISSTVLLGSTVTVNFVAPFTGPIIITLNVLGLTPLSDSVNVLNFPVSQIVTLASTTITGTVDVTGSIVAVATLPPVTIAAAQTIAVTNTGTFAVQATLGASSAVIGHVIVDSGTIAVTGTFWQATQPVSGTFWQATQPISGSVSVSNFPVTQPVSGTITANQGTSPWVVSLASTTITGTVAVTGAFWQATQPVSGVFWQTTQPVSGTITANQGTSPWVVSLASTTITGSVAVTGSFWQAVQPVSGTITANQGTSPWVVSNGGTFPVQASITTLGQQLAAASVPVVLTAAQLTTLTPLATVAVTQTTTPWVASLGNTTGKTVVMKTGTLTTTSVTANQVVLTYTVTAGKTFYLQYVKRDVQLTVTPGNGNPIALGTHSLESPALTKLCTTLSMYPTDQQDTLEFAEPIPFAAGTVIRIVVTPASTTSTLWVGNFGGYEK